MEEKHSSEIIWIPDHDEFPIGLKVLAIDANIVCLKYLVHLLHKCQYKVTATTEAAEAIKLLKDEKQAFDIIITNVVRHDMDGFEILHIIIGLGMDIPVVMVSANEELEMAKRGVMEGAEAYLLKPVRLQELKNIWQHVLRKRSARKRSNPNNALLLEHPHQHQLSIISHDHHHHQRVSIHKQNNNYESDHQIIELDRDNISNVPSSSSSSSKKKRRVSWTPKLHDKFVAAYEQLREKERVPNNILKLMNEPDLTRENVASHLQKHRDILRKKKAIRGVGKLVGQRNCYDIRNPPKASTIIYNSMNQIINKFPNLGPQLPISAQFDFPNRARSTMEELHGIHGGNPESTWTAAGSGCFPVPEFEWFNFPSNNSIPKPCNQEGFAQYPLLESHCLNSTSIQTLGNCPIDNVGAIPDKPATPASSFPNNNTAAGQCSQMQFDNGNSHDSLSMDDDLISEIFKKELFQSEGDFKV